MRQVVVGGAVVRDGRLLAARRTEPPQYAGGWELPGGKVDDGESDVEALVRELKEELDVDVIVGERVGGDWPLGDYDFRVWIVTVADGQEPRAAEQHDAVAWIDQDTVWSIDWLPGDIEPVMAVADLLGWSIVPKP